MPECNFHPLSNCHSCPQVYHLFFLTSENNEKTTLRASLLIIQCYSEVRLVDLLCQEVKWLVVRWFQDNLSLFVGYRPVSDEMECPMRGTAGWTVLDSLGFCTYTYSLTRSMLYPIQHISRVSEVSLLRTFFTRLEFLSSYIWPRTRHWNDFHRTELASSSPVAREWISTGCRIPVAGSSSRQNESMQLTRLSYI